MTTTPSPEPADGCLDCGTILNADAEDPDGEDSCDEPCCGTHTPPASEPHAAEQPAQVGEYAPDKDHGSAAVVDPSNEGASSIGSTRRAESGDCVFCRIVAGDEPATVVREWPEAIAIVPLAPVAEGHTLVIPRVHVTDAADAPAVTGIAARRAAELAASLSASAFNLITSRGRDATQTVFHLHWHVVPRYAGDGLALPWTEVSHG